MKKLILKSLLLFTTLLLTSVACKNLEEGEKFANDNLAKGGDISWLPQMEASGYIFYNDKGEPEDCFKILKDHGINSVRLRTWVNPSTHPQSGHCSRDETVEMAKRAKSWGMKVMINFHYSDSWADPGKQNKHKDWEGLNFEELKQALYDYTYDVMDALNKEGISPEWVQLGNEIPSGMIHPEGHTDNWAQLVQLLNKGYDAVKSVSPSSKIILHVDQGNNNERFRWWFDNAEKHGAKYDIIGMSFYPWWLEGKPDYKEVIDDLGNNLSDMANRYNKDVMVVEVGGEDSKPQNTYYMLRAVIEKVKAVPNSKGLGIFYWEPQGARSWSNYALSAWGRDGRPTKALDAFID